MRALSARNIIRVERRRLDFVDVAQLHEFVERLGLQPEPIVKQPI
jgi:hypothetical protein